MNVLEEAIAAYQTLLGKDFCLTIGTAQREILKIKFFFLPEHFIHLSGIGKLKDLADINGTKSRKNLYRRLVTGDIEYQYIQASAFFSEIDKRLHDFVMLPQLLNNLTNSKIIIKFNPALAGTRITADFLLYRKENEAIYHLFLKEHGDGIFAPVSFFSRNSPKFLLRQTKLKILNVEILDRK